MPGLKKHHPDFRFNDNRVTPDEIDGPQQYVVAFPSASATYIGTSAGGTAGQAKALVFLSAKPDYPRNLLYGVVGTHDTGGTWVVSGKDQFGDTITETVGWGTLAAGTPAGASAGTKIFAEVTGGTFTHAGVGTGSARLGVAVGTGGTIQHYFGLPMRIASVNDVKNITWSSEFTSTPINKGTVASASYVGTARHTFNGTATIAGTQCFVVDVISTYNSEHEDNIV